MKRVLKKTQAILKRGIMFLPVSLIPIGIALGITGTYVGTTKKEEVFEILSQNPEIQQMREEDIEVYNERLEKGEITNSEYTEKVNYVNSNNFIEDVLENPDFSEEKAFLKSETRVYELLELPVSLSVFLSGLGLSFGGLALVAWSDTVGEAVIDFWNSASDDWNWKPPEKDTLKIDL